MVIRKSDAKDAFAMSSYSRHFISPSDFLKNLERVRGACCLDSYVRELCKSSIHYYFVVQVLTEPIIQALQRSNSLFSQQH